MNKTIFVGVLGFALALPGGAAARPADVRIINTDPIGVTIANTPSVTLDAAGNTVRIDSGANVVKVDPSGNGVKLDASGNTVKIDSSANAVKLDEAGNTVKLDPSGNRVSSNLWSAYGEATATGTTPKTCSNVSLPGGRLILDTVVVTSYYAVTPPITYLLLLVRKGTNTGRFMNVRIPLSLSANDPATNTRYGTLHMGMNLQPGSLFDADVGAVYAIQACTTNTSGETAEASFIFSGTRHFSDP